MRVHIFLIEKYRYIDIDRLRGSRRMKKMYAITLFVLIRFYDNKHFPTYTLQKNEEKKNNFCLPQYNMEISIELFFFFT